jgi:hypothetical protein
MSMARRVANNVGARVKAIFAHRLQAFPEEESLKEQASMNDNNRRYFSPEQKVAILREHY